MAQGKCPRNPMTDKFPRGAASTTKVGCRSYVHSEPPRHKGPKCQDWLSLALLLWSWFRLNAPACPSEPRSALPDDRPFRFFLFSCRRQRRCQRQAAAATSPASNAAAPNLQPTY